MMKRETITIADVYVPVKRRATLEQKRVDEIAASMLDKGQQTPILVRADGARFVLVEGLHRLKPPRRSAKKLLSASLSTRGNINAPAPSIRFADTAKRAREPCTIHHDVGLQLALAIEAPIPHLRNPPNKGASNGPAPDQNAC